MKSILLIFFFALSIPSSALEFEKGANVKDIHPRELLSLVRQGIDTYEGAKIVISTDAKIPTSFQKKWDQRKLTGESIPMVGKKAPNVIFIKKF